MEKKVLSVVPRSHWEELMMFMHYSMVYWDAITVRRMIMYRYWWPKVCQYVFRYEKSCDPFHQMKKLLAYHTYLTRPITSMFQVFSIDSSGPFPEKNMAHIHLLVCVEHLMGWHIAVPTRYATAEALRNFISTEVIKPFGIP